MSETWERKAKQKNVTLSGLPNRVYVTCNECGKSWSPNLGKGGRMPKRWWACRSGCNHQRPVTTGFTVGALAAKITGGNERAMRGLLNDAARACGTPVLERYATRPNEVVGRDLVIAFVALRPGSREGRIAARLLNETTA